MNENFRQLLIIMRSTWLMDYRTAEDLLPMIVQWYNGMDVSHLIEGRSKKGERFGAMVRNPKGQQGFTFYDDLDMAPPDSTGVVAIEGILEKNDYCGVPGMATIAERIRMLDAHRNIGSMVLKFDTPGGTVDGTKDMADTIAKTQKPVVGWVDGMAASAGYWHTAATNHVMMSNDTSFVGSIGVTVQLADLRPVFERMGVKFHSVYAEQSQDKHKTFNELLKSNYKPIQEEELNPIADIFMDFVKENRSNVAEEALHGKMYIAEAAIRMGLADSVGTLEDAVNKAQEMGRKSKQVSNVQLNHKPMWSKNKFSKLAALATAEEITPEMVAAINEEIQAAGIDNVTLMMDSELDQLSSASEALTSAQAELESVRKELAAVTAERDQAQKTLAALDEQPGDEHSDPKKPGGDKSDQRTPQQVIDELPHNKALDENPYFARVQDN